MFYKDTTVCCLTQAGMSSTSTPKVHPGSRIHHTQLFQPQLRSAVQLSKRARIDPQMMDKEPASAEGIEG